MSGPTKVKLFGCWSCSSAAGGFSQLFCRTRSCVGSLWTWWMCNDSRNATALPSQGRAPLLSYCNEQIPTARPVLQLLSGVMQCTDRWMDLRWETLNRGNANNFPVNRCYVHSVPVALMLQGSRVHHVAFYLRHVPTPCPGVDINPVNVDRGMTLLWDISDVLTAYLRIVMENHFEILRHPSSRHSMQASK